MAAGQRFLLEKTSESDRFDVARGVGHGDVSAILPNFCVMYRAERHGVIVSR